MADFLEWSVHKAGLVTINLPRLDALLRASSLSAGLASCLTAEGGPLYDEAAGRRASRNARDAASNRLWAEAGAHPAVDRHSWLPAWLANKRRTGRLPASARQQVLADTLAVLAVLPDPGTGLARLATRVLGHAHALDGGPVQAAILRALAWHDGPPGAPEGSAGRRMLWAGAGGPGHRLLHRLGPRPHPARQRTGSNHAGCQRSNRPARPAHPRPGTPLPRCRAHPGRPGASHRVRLREPDHHRGRRRGACLPLCPARLR